MLAKVCADDGVTLLKLTLDVDTRWNSTWDMCDRALKMKRVSHETAMYMSFVLTVRLCIGHY